MKHHFYHTLKLKNGLKILTLPMRNRRSVAVTVWARVGSRFESNRLAGASHYLEHMLFKGTKKRDTRKIKEEIEGVGGLLNAFTSEESTCYYTKSLNEHFPACLEVLADMALNATLKAEELEKERTVILEEIKMYKDMPSQYVQELMGTVLWQNNSLGRPIAGSEKTVSAMSRKDIKDYRDRYYDPKNLMVTVAGSVRPAQVEELVDKHFPVKSQHSVKTLKVPKVKQTVPRVEIIYKDTEQVQLVVGFRTFSRYDSRRFALSILNVILGANMSSRLFEEVREKRGLAYDIRSHIQYFEDAGSYLISAGVELNKIEKAIALILRELKKIAQKGPTSGELKRAKQYFLNHYSMTVEDTLDFALWAGERYLYCDEIPGEDEIRASILKVSTEDVKKVAAGIFKNNGLNMTILGPVRDKVQSSIKKNFHF